MCNVYAMVSGNAGQLLVRHKIPRVNEEKVAQDHRMWRLVIQDLGLRQRAWKKSDIKSSALNFLEGMVQVCRSVDDMA